MLQQAMSDDRLAVLAGGLEKPCASIVKYRQHLPAASTAGVVFGYGFLRSLPLLRGLALYLNTNMGSPEIPGSVLADYESHATDVCHTKIQQRVKAWGGPRRRDLARMTVQVQSVDDICTAATAGCTEFANVVSLLGCTSKLLGELSGAYTSAILTVGTATIGHIDSLWSRATTTLALYGPAWDKDGLVALLDVPGLCTMASPGKVATFIASELAYCISTFSFGADHSAHTAIIELTSATQRANHVVVNIASVEAILDGPAAAKAIF